MGEKPKRSTEFKQINDPTIKHAANLAYWRKEAIRWKEEYEHLMWYKKGELKIARKVIGENARLADKVNGLIRINRRLEKRVKFLSKKVEILTGKIKRIGKKWYKRLLKKGELR